MTVSVFLAIPSGPTAFVYAKSKLTVGVPLSFTAPVLSCLSGRDL